jgi:release factor glutamine methyltransferase
VLKEAKAKHGDHGDVVIFDILFSLSLRIKNKEQFVQSRNLPIDFNKKTFDRLLQDYFTKNRPLVDITKKARFYKLNFDVFSGILVPRSETELLCEKVIHILQKYPNLTNGVDLCCGSGNIAIAISKNCPNINFTTVDIQPLAIKNTLHNAKKHDVKLKTITGDFYRTLIKRKLKFDFIVCNPPYVSLLEVDKSLFNFEHQINFSNSDDPLFFYKTIIDNYQKLIINPHNFLIAFEIGHNQKQLLMSILKQNHLLMHAKFYRDYANNDRILIIQKINNRT